MTVTGPTGMQDGFDGTPFKARAITLDFFMSQLRVAIVAVLAYGGGAKWFTPETAGLYMALFTSLGPIAIPWIWSIAANLGKVHVASGSAAATVAMVENVDPQSAMRGAAKAVVENNSNPAAPTVA